MKPDQQSLSKTTMNLQRVLDELRSEKLIPFALTAYELTEKEGQ